ncbi:AAA family ATPase [Zavarzinia sp. CC-PAN008]|uniref:bifunctional aminoglycoside phosphotransferase/ATP-binding protein n=1 Tax=Zavarzinia sp. CC-PAN008 TaxID=3243332 RepID=UPI003F7423B1
MAAARPDEAALVAFLADPASHGGLPVERHDTHVSVVVLAGERALKLKRAVDRGYLDQSTAERRRLACAAELRLNRAWAPGLYLGLQPILARPGGLALGPLRPAAEAGPGEDVVDWLVVMRRFPTADRLDHVLAAGRLDATLAAATAETIGAVHRHLAPVPGPSRLAGAVRQNAGDLLAADLPPERARALGQGLVAAHARVLPGLEARAAAGLVRRCHGDLHLANLCLLDGRPTAFDALEFSEDLSTIDVLHDLAFLVMDLLARGRRDLAHRVLDRWLEVTGWLDQLDVLPLFLALRAAVRAHVSARMGQPDGARAYLELGLDLLRPVAPRLVAIGGLSGTGKTTLARALAPAFGAAPGAVILRSDVLRKQLAGVPPEQALPPEAYGVEAGRAVYAELVRRADLLLRQGCSVVLDAVFARVAERDAAAAVARTVGVAFAGLWLDLPLAERLARVAGRRGDASDAGVAQVQAQESYDLGPIAWTRLAAGPDLVARARAVLPD